MKYYIFWPIIKLYILNFLAGHFWREALLYDFFHKFELKRRHFSDHLWKVWVLFTQILFCFLVKFLLHFFKSSVKPPWWCFVILFDFSCNFLKLTPFWICNYTLLTSYNWCYGFISKSGSGSLVTIMCWPWSSSGPALVDYFLRISSSKVSNENLDDRYGGVKLAYFTVVSSPIGLKQFPNKFRYLLLN